ncbi:MAG: hypothetical protein WC788_07255 [Candidatus Paceibacterota bacterium]
MEKLKKQLDEIRTTFQELGYEIVTMIDDIQKWDWNNPAIPKTEVIRQEYILAKTCDIALCIYTSLDPSEGRGWDAGFFAGMGKPTIMAIHNSISDPYIEGLFSENPANKILNVPAIIRYENFEDIARTLNSIA